MMRLIRHTCFMASSKSTRSITGFVSLYSLRQSTRMVLRASQSEIES